METIKNLAEALLMMSIIICVLVATSEFDNQTVKMAIMVSLGVLAVISAAARVWCGMKEVKEEN